MGAWWLVMNLRWYSLLVLVVGEEMWHGEWVGRVLWWSNDDSSSGMRRKKSQHKVIETG